MSYSIGTTRVEDVMRTKIITVFPTDKMEDVAKTFVKNDINCAPVVNDAGECIGIITNHDLAEYESVRLEVDNELKHGYFFDLARYGDGTMPRTPGFRFNEVFTHMTKNLKTAGLDDTLSRVARTMCTEHIHHVVVLDDDRKLVGMLSSLDILGEILNESVSRKPKSGRVS